MKTNKQLLVGIAALALSALVFAGPMQAPGGAAAATDSSLAPWIGIWTLLADRAQDRAGEADSQATVVIQPAPDGKGFAITRKAPQQPEAKETLILDGSKQPIEAKDCAGWQSAKWIPETAVIIGSSAVTCKDSGSFSTSSLKMMLAADQMIDIFGIKTGDQMRVATRRLQFSRDLPSAGSSRSGPAGTAARMAAAAPWKLEGVLNLSGMVDVPILQAALVEKNVQLDVNAKSLKKMRAAGLPDEIVDLLVALAFPREFHVQTDGRVKLQSVSDSSAGLSGSSYFPSAFPSAFYYSSPYPYYYRDNWFYYGSPFWSDYYFILVPSYGYGGGGGAGSGSGYSGGYASSSKGYVQISPVDTGRHAVPRGSNVPSGGSSGTYSSPPAVYSGSSASAPASSSDGGGGSSSSSGASGGSSSSSPSSPSASPSGYSSGGSSGGSAVPRP